MLSTLFQISNAEAVNNNQIRNCIQQESFEEGGNCIKDIQNCFQDKECEEEYMELFVKCMIPENYQPYNGKCAHDQSQKIQLDSTKKMVDCLQKHCQILENYSGREEYPTNDDLKLIENEKTNEKQKLEENFACLNSALSEDSKCKSLADECDQSCMEELNKIQTCMIDKKCRQNNLFLITHELSDQNAQNLALCILSVCHLQ